MSIIIQQILKKGVIGVVVGGALAHGCRPRSFVIVLLLAAPLLSGCHLSTAFPFSAGFGSINGRGSRCRLLSPPTSTDDAPTTTTGHAALSNAGIIVDHPLSLLFGLALPHLLQAGLELGRCALLLLHLGSATAACTGPTDRSSISCPKGKGRRCHGRRGDAAGITIVVVRCIPLIIPEVQIVFRAGPRRG